MSGGLTPSMRAELEALGFRPSRRLGQNFMRDGNMIAALAREAGVAGGELVLEPGPGAGGLTAELLDLGASVVAVELDSRLAEYLRRRFAGNDRLTLVEGDILAEGRDINPGAPAALAGRPFTVCSNLPYSAGTPFLISLAGSELPWRAAAVTVQKEVAERLCAAPGSPAYGAAGVLVGVRASARLMRRVPPDVFWPRPKVESAILRLEPLADPAVSAAEFTAFAGMVRGLFSARRKRLPRAMAASGIEPSAVAQALERSGADSAARPEDLSPLQLAQLWRGLPPPEAG
jgi:16S rRNA (adenine1518-N6/adenine1519-N6)-dimethyltransferase